VIKNGDGLPLPGSQVTVLQNDTLASVMTGTLNSALEFAANVPAGQYQVCINPPIGWENRVRSTNALAGWICSPADLKTSPQLVTFRLTSQVSGGPVSAHGRRRLGPEPSPDGPAPLGPAQFGWALVVIAAALIGGLAAAATRLARRRGGRSVVIGAVGAGPAPLARAVTQLTPPPAIMPRAQPPRAAPPPESCPPDPVPRRRVVGRTRAAGPTA
jgi:hypothetical protein